jgi:hypothetical protein
MQRQCGQSEQCNITIGNMKLQALAAMIYSEVRLIYDPC